MLKSNIRFPWFKSCKKQLTLSPLPRRFQTPSRKIWIWPSPSVATTWSPEKKNTKPDKDGTLSNVVRNSWSLLGTKWNQYGRMVPSWNIWENKHGRNDANKSRGICGELLWVRNLSGENTKMIIEHKVEWWPLSCLKAKNIFMLCDNHMYIEIYILQYIKKTSRCMQDCIRAYAIISPLLQNNVLYTKHLINLYINLGGCVWLKPQLNSKAKNSSKCMRLYTYGPKIRSWKTCWFPKAPSLGTSNFRILGLGDVFPRKRAVWVTTCWDFLRLLNVKGHQFTLDLVKVFTKALATTWSFSLGDG